MFCWDILNCESVPCCVGSEIGHDKLCTCKLGCESGKFDVGKDTGSTLQGVLKSRPREEAEMGSKSAAK